MYRATVNRPSGRTWGPPTCRHFSRSPACGSSALFHTQRWRLTDTCSSLRKRRKAVDFWSATHVVWFDSCTNDHWHIRYFSTQKLFQCLGVFHPSAKTRGKKTCCSCSATGKLGEKRYPPSSASQAPVIGCDWQAGEHMPLPLRKHRRFGSVDSQQ